MRKRVIVSVSNDLSTDNRVDKVCNSIMQSGWEVLLVGRHLPDSLPLTRPYATRRLHLLFRKGFLFYAEFNFRLFFFLLFNKADALHANDLDTLAANTLARFFKGVPLVYDSHEYFTEVPEIIHKPLVKGIWETIERLCFYKPDKIFTVNQSIAGLYNAKYKRPIAVMRNIPNMQQEFDHKTRADLALPSDKFILVLQGAGINVHRGAEEMLEAMRMLDDSFLWLIIGNGDVVSQLKARVAKYNMEPKVSFLPKMPYKQMMGYTAVANLGLTLDKPNNINYLYSLPNKVFDYLSAGIPVLASNLPEVAAVINAYDVGWTFSSHNPSELAKTILAIKNDLSNYAWKKENTQKAKMELSWDKEAQELKAYYQFLS